MFIFYKYPYMRGGYHLIPADFSGRGYYKENDNAPWQKLTVDHPVSAFLNVGPTTRSKLALMYRLNENDFIEKTDEEVREMVWIDVV